MPQSTSGEPFPPRPDRVSHPRHFELSSLRHVPDSHAWHDLNDHPSAGPSGPDAIPVIDLSSPDATAALGRACEEWGVFQATGHGVPSPLLDRLDTQVSRLFSLPTDRKLRAARSPGSLSGYGLAPISSFFSKFMWSEGFTVSGDPSDHARLLWPDGDDQFCDVMKEYNKEMKALAGRLMHLMLRSLGLSEDDVKYWRRPAWDYREVSAVLQLNWYPACPSPEQAMGMAAHTDSGLLAVVHQSTVAGLQVLRAEDQAGPSRWVTVPPLQGGLVVNVGDLAHILSNGRFRSVVHRAVVNRERERLSAAYICGPPEDVKVHPLVAGQYPWYRAVTWPEYRGLKARLFDKALASIRVSKEEEDHHGSSSSSAISSCV